MRNNASLLNLGDEGKRASSIAVLTSGSIDPKSCNLLSNSCSACLLVQRVGKLLYEHEVQISCSYENATGG